MACRNTAIYRTGTILVCENTAIYRTEATLACENTAIYRTGATLALEMAARACPGAAGGLGRAVPGLLWRRQCAQNGRFGLPWCRHCAQKGCSSLLRLPVRSKWPFWRALVPQVRSKSLLEPASVPLSALKEAVRACCSRSLFKSAGLGYTLP